MRGEIVCSCGLRQEVAAMVKRGWQTDGAGSALLLANCVGPRCGSTIAVAAMADACTCATCRRLVTGAGGDVKICVVDDSAGAIVLCAPCFRRDPRRANWTRWHLAPPDAWSTEAC